MDSEIGVDQLKAISLVVLASFPASQMTLEWGQGGLHTL